MRLDTEVNALVTKHRSLPIAQINSNSMVHVLSLSIEYT